MHCPKCGQRQASELIRFCSKCGFSMTGVAALLAGGEVPGMAMQRKKKDSPKKRGIKQGVFIFLLSFLVVPLVAMFHIATQTPPILAALALFLFGIGGLLRIVYALMFESADSPDLIAETGVYSASQQNIGGSRPAEALPDAGSIPASLYSGPSTGKWRDTNDLREPLSVTDSTTKLLAEEKSPDQ